MGTARPKFIVGIGGSAGGLKAYIELLDALSPDTGMAFVVVAHLLPSANSQLAQILSSHTRMAVAMASDGMRVRANHVYVIPPNADLFMKRDTLKVHSPRAQRNEQIDLFLLSLAESIGARAIGIILSGYDGDGTAGCKHIKAKGGTTFAQDMSADVGDMPLSARDAGCVDFVLPPAKIAAKLEQLARSSRGQTP